MTVNKYAQIPASEFKAKCLELMEQVSRTRRTIVITKRGKPVAKLVPPDEPVPRAPFFGYMAGKGKINGDIVDRPRIEWSALSGDEDKLYAGLGVSPAGSASLQTRRRRRK
jgi:prevent-host-death family protein